MKLNSVKWLVDYHQLKFNKGIWSLSASTKDKAVLSYLNFNQQKNAEDCIKVWTEFARANNITNFEFSREG